MVQRRGEKQPEQNSIAGSDITCRFLCRVDDVFERLLVVDCVVEGKAVL